MIPFSSFKSNEIPARNIICHSKKNDNAEVEVGINSEGPYYRSLLKIKTQEERAS
jgi:hypothetical protein